MTFMLIRAKREGNTPKRRAHNPQQQHTVLFDPQVFTADSILAVACRKTEPSTGGQTHLTEHTEVMWGSSCKENMR